MKKGLTAGLTLSLFGISLFIISVIPVTRTAEVIDASFTLAPGEQRGPYDDDTYYHTKVLVKSALKGEITVDGGAIHVTAKGYNIKNLDRCFEGAYSFTIVPAEDQYTFIFDNTGGTTECTVKFVLTEVWTGSLSPLVWVLGLAGILILTPSGLIISALFQKASGRANDNL